MRDHDRAVELVASALAALVLAALVGVLGGPPWAMAATTGIGYWTLRNRRPS